MRMQLRVCTVQAIVDSDPNMRGLFVTFVSAAKTGSWNVVKKESKRKDIDYVKRFL